MKIKIYIILILLLVVTIASTGIVSAEMSIDTSTFAENGYVNVMIRNTGSSSGTFGLTLSGDSSGHNVLSMTNGGNALSNMFQFNAGEIKTIPVYITVSTSSRTCTFSNGVQENCIDYSYTSPTVTGRIKVYDYNKPSNYDEKEFIITIPNVNPVIISKSLTDTKANNELAIFTLIVKNEGTDGYITLHIDPQLNNKYLISTDSVYEGGRFDGNYNWKHFTKSGDVATFIARFQPNAIGDGYIRFSVISSSDSSIIEDTVTAKIYPPQETPGFDIVLSIISITLVMSLLRFSNKEK